MTVRPCALAAFVAALWIVGVSLGVAPVAAQSRPATREGAQTPERTRTPEQAPSSTPMGAPRSTSPIVIDADRMEALRREGLVIFTGNVVAKQDNSVQTADRMEVYLDDQGERVSRIVSTGNVRIVTEDCRTGTARRAEYYDDEQRLILIGDAKVWQEQNVVSGEEIEILLVEERSTVTGSPRARVKSIFYPRGEGSEQGGIGPAATGKGTASPPCG